MCGAAIAVLLAPAIARADWKSAPIVPRLDAATAKQMLATDVLAKVGD